MRLVGVAGLVAGAFSMAAGEYLSMTAQRELMERELEVERGLARQSPEGEALELRGMYESGASTRRGPGHGARGHADPQLALETHAREELGISPEHLGSPVQSALSSFFTFALGAFIPLVPWLITRGTAAIVASVVLSASPPSRSASCWPPSPSGRCCAPRCASCSITAGAAAVTYGVGRGIGTGIG